ncbi:MAG TPA: TIGR04063 family PEP-CTERM/XrtA system glycosyltransferase [Gammaproteobacteria bacterium]|nr:TIGR04063 family PEP-CTERM/XrtA system glycosyltransferase [Gammaproteobacteria bacterium]
MRNEAVATEQVDIRTAGRQTVRNRNAGHWRVLHVLDHSIPLHSGYSFRTLAILREQAAHGWKTFHITSPKQIGAEQPEEVVDGLDFYRTLIRGGVLERLPVFGEIKLMHALRRRLDEVVELVRPDVIHAHSPVLNALPALSIARRRRLPLVYEVRAFWEDAGADLGTSPEGSIRYRAVRRLESHALKQADAITTICEGLRQDIIARGIEPSKVTVIPNAADPDRFEFDAVADTGLLHRFNLAPGKVIGFAGSFYAYEGLGSLIEAMPRVVEAVPDASLLLVGGGPEEAHLRARVEALDLEDVVHFAGRVPHEAVARYYSVMDVMVFPRVSRRLTELVTPLKPLEAMAQGKLVVASDVGGHRELIRHGETGYLVPPDNRAALAERLIALFESPDVWMAMRVAGRRFVESERNWHASVDRYSEVYRAAQLAALGKDA